MLLRSCAWREHVRGFRRASFTGLTYRDALADPMDSRLSSRIVTNTRDPFLLLFLLQLTAREADLLA